MLFTSSTRCTASRAEQPRPMHCKSQLLCFPGLDWHRQDANHQTQGRTQRPGRNGRERGRCDVAKATVREGIAPRVGIDWAVRSSGGTQEVRREDQAMVSACEADGSAADCAALCETHAVKETGGGEGSKKRFAHQDSDDHFTKLQKRVRGAHRGRREILRRSVARSARPPPRRSHAPQSTLLARARAPERARACARRRPRRRAPRGRRALSAHGPPRGPQTAEPNGTTR
eukprot:1514837-Pleurochrysis_carterae.AAC.1